MKTLSKSKLIAFRQCARRLWLEVHAPELREETEAAQARFAVGHTVGSLARRLYDPKGQGAAIDVEREGYPGAIARTAELLKGERPIFEAAFAAGGVLAFADILVKRRSAAQPGWRVVEVKSSGSVKDYHHDDLAIQSHAMRAAGLAPAKLSIAHVDGTWVYPGHEDYAGILREVDLTQETHARAAETAHWVRSAHQVVASEREPRLPTGAHCHAPFACGFYAHCASKEPKIDLPVDLIPGRRSKALEAHLADPAVRDLRDVPDELLNADQLRVKQHTVENRVFFDADGAAAALAGRSLPAYFLDFETVSFTVPIWKGTRPFRQIPFQFSLHVLGRDRTLRHREFLDLTGTDPSRRLAEALIGACGERGPIYIYTHFEVTRIRELAERFPDLRRALSALLERTVDLQRVVKPHYYHPAQKGSWGLKAVLPTLAPELAYDDLDIADGAAASTAYLEAISRETTIARKAEIEAQLRAYCGRDTLGLVRIWERCLESCA